MALSDEMEKQLSKDPLALSRETIYMLLLYAFIQKGFWQEKYFMGCYQTLIDDVALSDEMEK